jgi:hypothetical protein
MFFGVHSPLLEVRLNILLKDFEFLEKFSIFGLLSLELAYEGR